MPYCIFVKRTTIWLTTQQAKELSALAAKKGTKVAELIRRALDDFLVRQKGK
jgi:hypothetical protein